jgi:hypothetical protein
MQQQWGWQPRWWRWYNIADWASYEAWASGKERDAKASEGLLGSLLYDGDLPSGLTAFACELEKVHDVSVVLGRNPSRADGGSQRVAAGLHGFGPRDTRSDDVLGAHARQAKERRPTAVEPIQQT